MSCSTDCAPACACSARSYGAPTALVAAGGVAANQAIRKVLHRLAFEVGTVLVAPPLELCTDNGAMIAWAGCERLALGLTDTLEVAPRARWPLDEIAAAKGARQRTAACSDDHEHDHRTHRRARRRRLGNGAGADLRARRPRRDAVGARCRAMPSISRRSARADFCPACGSTTRSRSTRDLAEAAAADAILLVVPAQADARGRDALAPQSPRHAADRLRQGHRARHAQIHDRDHRRMRAARPMPAILSGPSFAADVARGLPTAVTLAAADATIARALAQALNAGTFRPYHSTDVRGVEIGGAAKNVLAIAAGIVTGRGLGASASAALTTRGFAELVRFGKAYGAKTETHDGPVRPRRSDSDLLDAAVAQFLVRRRARQRRGAGHRRAWQTGGRRVHRAGAAGNGARRRMSTCRSRAAVAAVLAEKMSVDDAQSNALLTRPLKRRA